VFLVRDRVDFGHECRETVSNDESDYIQDSEAHCLKYRHPFQPVLPHLPTGWGVDNIGASNLKQKKRFACDMMSGLVNLKCQDTGTNKKEHLEKKVGRKTDLGGGTNILADTTLESVVWGRRVR